MTRIRTTSTEMRLGELAMITEDRSLMGRIIERRFDGIYLLGPKADFSVKNTFQVEIVGFSEREFV